MKYTIKDGIVYDAKKLLADVEYGVTRSFVKESIHAGKPEYHIGVIRGESLL